MYCRVLSPSFIFLQFQLCDIRIVDITRRCKPLVFAFYKIIIAIYEVLDFQVRGRGMQAVRCRLTWTCPKVDQALMLLLFLLMMIPTPPAQINLPHPGSARDIYSCGTESRPQTWLQSRYMPRFFRPALIRHFSASYSAKLSLDLGFGCETVGCHGLQPDPQLSPGVFVVSRRINRNFIVAFPVLLQNWIARTMKWAFCPWNMLAAECGTSRHWSMRQSVSRMIIANLQWTSQRWRHNAAKSS